MSNKEVLNVISGKFGIKSIIKMHKTAYKTKK